MFTFSFASISGLDAITRRRAIDMTGWICDGGPFRRIEEGFQSLIESGPLIPPQWHKLDTPFVRKLILVRLAKLSSWLCGSTDYDKDIDRMLALLPDHFPVLSIRCEQDTLVKPAQIEDFFNKTNHLQLNSVTLKKAGHLLGFRDEPELYKEWVSRFLETVAQPV